MARPLRIEYPGAYYHVMSRGNAGENIFPGRKDKERLLEYLAKAVDQYTIVIHTYCLMSNHYHLLMETPQANLSSAMQWLNVSYAVSYNRRHGRNGHLFGGRFKALLIDAEAYLTHLSRYIHLNPVRAKMVRRPEDYPWSSYPALVDQVRKPDWLETRELLSYFAPRGSSHGKSDKKEAIKYYRAFVQDVDPEAVENPAKQAAGGFIVGGSDFVRWVQESFLARRKDEKAIPQLKVLRPRIPVGAIVEAVSREFDGDEERILEKGHKRNTARDIAISLSRSHSGVSCSDLGVTFGGISGSAISERCKELSKELARDRQLRGRMERIERRILTN